MAELVAVQGTNWHGLLFRLRGLAVWGDKLSQTAPASGKERGETKNRCHWGNTHLCQTASHCAATPQQQCGIWSYWYISAVLRYNISEHVFQNPSGFLASCMTLDMAHRGCMKTLLSPDVIAIKIIKACRVRSELRWLMVYVLNVTANFVSCLTIQLRSLRLRSGLCSLVVLLRSAVWRREPLLVRTTSLFFVTFLSPRSRNLMILFFIFAYLLQVVTSSIYSLLASIYIAFFWAALHKNDHVELSTFFSIHGPQKWVILLLFPLKGIR